MDILDIDEVLKDDSFCFLEDKTQDDVSNILQQWRKNTGRIEQDTTKLDTRTFTRHKKKSVQNLEPNFLSTLTMHNEKENSTNHMLLNNEDNNTTNSAISLRIGGLVTTSSSAVASPTTNSMERSFLQDTSPPQSICSSIDFSMDRSNLTMNNSLITSTDFANVTFLESSNIDDIEVLKFPKQPSMSSLALSIGDNKAEYDGYSLEDIIKDRKALENLTLSGDSTLIKDSNIAQFDENLILSKTNSSTSTMYNSTDSFNQNETLTPFNIITVDNNRENPSSKPSSSSIEAFKDALSISSGMNNIKMFDDIQNNEDLIINTTFDLNNSIFSIKAQDNSLISQMHNAEENSKTKEDLLSATNCNRTQLLGKTFEEVPMSNQTFTENKSLERINVNETFDFIKMNNTFDIISQEENNSDEKLKRTNIQSTPQPFKYPIQILPTPSMKSIINEVNISPIVPDLEKEVKELNQSPMNNTEILSNNEKNQTYLNDINALELYLDMKNQGEENRKQADNQRKSIEGLDEFDDDPLIAEKTDEEFDNILEKISKSTISEESRKMRESLENIKKRYSLATEKQSSNILSNSNVSRTNFNELQNSSSSSLSSSSLSSTEKIRPISQTIDSTLNVVPSVTGKSSPVLSGLSTSGGSTERLLSRRSRLYDDIKLSVSDDGTAINQSPTMNGKMKDEKSIINAVLHQEKTELNKTMDNKMLDEQQEKTENGAPIKNEVVNNRNKQQDRERFKTIRIFKRADEENVINIPCIDKEDDLNDEKFEEQKANNELGPDRFSTYRKSKTISLRSIKYENIPSSLPDENRTNSTTTSTDIRTDSDSNITKPRSLSRPRYISNLAKFGDNRNQALLKANSANDIENSSSNSNVNAEIVTGTKITKIGGYGINEAVSSETNRSNIGTIPKPQLKSPMGTKAKSFHNLAGLHGIPNKFGNSSKPNPQLSSPQQHKIESDLKEKSTSNLYVRRNQYSSISRPITARTHQDNKQEQRSDQFKIPQPVSNLRNANSKRIGLVRPSSGYYSYNIAPMKNESDSDNGRHSPNSLSSASSRGSVHELNRKCVNGKIGQNIPQQQKSDECILSTREQYNTKITGMKKANGEQVNTATMNQVASTTETSVTVSAEGAEAKLNIPKPSGIRPPSNIKRSGLPRPSSIVRR